MRPRADQATLADSLRTAKLEQISDAGYLRKCAGSPVRAKFAWRARGSRTASPPGENFREGNFSAGYRIGSFFQKVC